MCPCDKNIIIDIDVRIAVSSKFLNTNIQKIQAIVATTSEVAMGNQMTSSSNCPTFAAANRRIGAMETSKGAIRDFNLGCKVSPEGQLMPIE